MCRCGWNTCGDDDAAEAVVVVVTRAMSWVAVGVVVHHLQVDVSVNMNVALIDGSFVVVVVVANDAVRFLCVVCVDVGDASSMIVVVVD